MIQLRPYSPNDFEEIYQLLYETVHRINCKDYTLNQVDAWAPKEPPQSLVGGFDKNFTRVAILEDRSVGFIELTPVGFVKGLYTHHAQQGSGVGRLLMEAAIQEGKKRGLRELHVESSLTARFFYEKMGFIAVEEKIKQLRGESVPIILMTRPL